jgi:hypothetical protein
VDIKDMKPGESYVIGPKGLRPLSDVLLDELTTRMGGRGPRWTHDCSACVYLGSLAKAADRTIVDIYRQCGVSLTHDGSQAYLMRRSSNGSDYTSGLTIKDLILTLFREGWI